MSRPGTDRAGLLLVRALLRLYPAEFRRRFGGELVAAYRAQAEARRRRTGVLGLAGLWARTGAGMLAGAWSEWTTRSTTGGGTMTGWVRELRTAARRLARAPLFAVTAVGTLGLGVGAFTAVWAVVDSVLLEPMPYDDPEELVWVWRDYVGRDFPRGWLGGPDVVGLQAETRVFEAVSAVRSERANLTGPDGDRPRNVRVTLTSAGFFDLLGRHPTLGRGFLPGEDTPGAEPVVVLSHRLWTEAFGADPDIVGRTVHLDRMPWTVVGVTPPDLDFVMHSSLGDPVPGDLYAPLRQDLAAAEPGNGWLAGLARRSDGATPAEEEEALARVAGRVSDGWSVELRLWPAPLKEDLVGSVRTPLLAVLVSAAFLLLVLAVNLAALFLARAGSLRRDRAVRTALGAGRRALVAVEAAETTILATGGAAVALVLGYQGAGLLRSVAASALPRGSSVALDLSGALVAVALCGAIATAAALVPLIRALGSRPAEVLRRSGGRTASGRGRGQGMLVGAQVALTVVMLVGAALLGRSLGALLRTDPGYDVGRALTLGVYLDPTGYPDGASLVAFQRDLLARLESLPGVHAAGASDALPLGLDTNQSTARFPDAPRNVGDPSEDGLLADVFLVSPGYVEAAGLRLLAGRGLRAGDEEEGVVAILVDDVLARRFFPDPLDAVGARAVLYGDTVTVAGVVDQARLYDVHRDDRGQVYAPNGWGPRREFDVVLRTGGDPLALAAAVRAVVDDLDPSVPVSDVRTMRDIFDGAMGEERLNLVLVSSFAAAGLLLSLLGVYGVVANTVARRTREIGVRMALGARSGEVVGMVLRQGMLVVAVGLVLGLAGAMVAARLMASLLVGVRPGDPAAFGGVTMVLAVAAGLAAWLPARRAASVDPVETLGTE